MTLPQGISKKEFAEVSLLVRAAAARFGTDICVHGSRASGTAGPESDLDIAIRVPDSEFDRIARERFQNIMSGTAKERTMLHAVRQGKIQTGELGLRGVRRELEKLLGMPVQISVIRVGGPFDSGPFIPLVES